MKGEAEAPRDRGDWPIRGPGWDPESPDWGVFEGGLETNQSRRLAWRFGSGFGVWMFFWAQF